MSLAVKQNEVLSV